MHDRYSDIIRRVIKRDNVLARFGGGLNFLACED